MLKFLLLLAVLGILLFFLRQFLEALFLTTVVVFTVFFFAGLVFTFQGLTGGDWGQTLGGLAVATFAAAYLLAAYLHARRKKEEK
ncbi:MAG: hypothetical protein GXO08_00250 [Aquificae bacterium]|nr:hypothetical protein [Aquificota bacterium]